MKQNSIYTESVALHKKLKGKLEIYSKVKIKNSHDLSLVYTPGVAEVSKLIAADHRRAFDLTIKRNTVAIVSDGSAVLGLGNIGPYGAIPVMEGKAVLFKEQADIDAFPICVATQNAYEIINVVKNIAPVFAGINLEDISAPRCFEIEDALQDIGIPVMHDDQHGTAIVLLAALINAARLAGKKLQDLIVTVNGAGAAGTAIVNLLRCVGQDKRICQPVKDIFVCDSKGLLSLDRDDIVDHPHKIFLASISNHKRRNGTLRDAIAGSDVFIGVSKGNLLTGDMIQTMNQKPIIFAMANPVPEIMPDEAIKAGAFIVGTGRSDFPNQVNNVLAFPGIFRGAIDAHAKRITNSMKIGAAFALASCVEKPTRENILPSALDKSVPKKIAARVAEIYRRDS
ncbi:malate dehydrogenase [Candidatus Gottesmanbacteria bacterium RIFCSPLOWO2_01_FULL_43_11b]|uniref:Malate dehydrogenase n=1 Tax=Candidatus Gottesmanbacteria bacterium RIFCSPLOWO2_01_FULL_43_11b TaxID=1798392 RepID=A0A1F6AH59_9BACT|nr:MAG: malate dehydrogenase [Candidatus Gottesmanbacteria bacterium RIFCSPLOWO2_01_FULL_43_11b]